MRHLALVVALLLVADPAVREAQAQLFPPWGRSADEEVPPAAGSRGENFSAGKSPAQLFASDCTGAGCHRSAQGLAKGRSAGSLAGFLRAHYTNSRESASALAAYLASLPGDAKPVPTPRQPPPPPRPTARPDDTAKPDEPRPGRKPAPEAARPDPRGAKPEPAKPETARPDAKPDPKAARSAPAAKPQPAAPPPEAAPAPEPPAPPPPPPKKEFDIFE